MRRIPLICVLLAALLLLSLAGCEDASPVLAGTPTPAATPTPLPDPFSAEITAEPIPTDLLGNQILLDDHYFQYLSFGELRVYEYDDGTFLDGLCVNAFPLPLDGEVDSPEGFGRVQVSHYSLNDHVVEGLECLDIGVVEFQLGIDLGQDHFRRDIACRMPAHPVSEDNKPGLGPNGEIGCYRVFLIVARALADARGDVVAGFTRSPYHARLLPPRRWTS